MQIGTDTVAGSGLHRLDARERRVEVAGDFERLALTLEEDAVRGIEAHDVELGVKARAKHAEDVLVRLAHEHP